MLIDLMYTKKNRKKKEKDKNKIEISLNQLMYSLHIIGCTERKWMGKRGEAHGQSHFVSTIKKERKKERREERKKDAIPHLTLGIKK